jgi:hypothetical protein
VLGEQVRERAAQRLLLLAERQVDHERSHPVSVPSSISLSS